ncbi:uncharacterized protein LOC125775350 [Bactrocera dorsalis]|uniref:Uncharacterized protein LOC125775350 n=1 Tax=Bactrocera dorsalis TaxID=27457 RepID=A0ABM3IXU6_BACDO|nr:uncharacterized protein LOC125775350 [Bactrocera dorsalis]
MPNNNNIRCVQINLQHSKSATANLTTLVNEGGIDISLIQEPWVNEDSIKGLNSSNYNLFYTRNRGKPRACILINKSINSFLCPNYSTADITVVKVEQKEKPFFLVSAYLAHDEDIPPAPLTRLVEENKKDDVLIGCDANARHTVWGSSSINTRGESLLQYILNSNLSICNKGDKPTFIFPSSDRFPGWEKVLDLTLSADTDSLVVDNWRLSDEPSMSDHSCILFSIRERYSAPLTYRNPRRTKWGNFTSIATKSLEKEGNNSIRNPEELDSEVEKLEKILTTTFNKSTPLTVLKKRKSLPWWNSHLKNLRTQLRKAFSESFRTKIWQSYKDIFKEYKKAVRKAKNDSWRPEPPLNAADYRSQIVDKRKIKYAINSFAPFKAAGPDGFMPIMLQKLVEPMVLRLENIYKASIQLSYIPRNWKRSKVAFLPKPGRRKHEKCQGF